MKKFTKLIAVLSAVALISGVVAGCGGTEKEKEKEVAKTDGTTFSYWTVIDGDSSSTITNYNEMMMYQELEKRTNVHIDFIHPVAGSTGNEAFMVMVSGTTMPDMVEYNWNGYNGGAQQALDDGIIVTLNDYLKDYAPNYYSYLEGDKAADNNHIYKLQTTTDEGNYYGFNVLNVGSIRGFAGLFVRSDKLNEWGMEVPSTIDEWTAVFAKAKAEGFEKPFTCDNNVISFVSADVHGFNTAFDVGKLFYVEGDDVVFAPFQNGYKEYVAQMAEWAKAGYLDTSYITNDSSKIEGNMANDISIAAWGYVGGGLGKILPALKEKNESYDLVGCPYPVANKGDVSRFQMVYPEANDKAIAITKDCGNVEAACTWADYFYSEEGMILQLFGIEGDTFVKEEREDGTHYVYTDKIRKHEGFQSVGEALYHYLLPCNHPGFNQHEDYLYGYYPYQSQLDALETWNAGVEKARPHKLPPVANTEEELREIIDIQEIAEPELEIAINDIILGKKSIDSYDDAIQAAKDNGYDRWIEIMQDSYNRYLAKLK